MGLFYNTKHLYFTSVASWYLCFSKLLWRKKFGWVESLQKYKKKKKMHSTSLDQLPLELFAYLYSYLPWKDLINMEHLNKTLRQIFYSSIPLLLFSENSLLPMFDIDPKEPIAKYITPLELYTRTKHFLCLFPTTFKKFRQERRLTKHSGFMTDNSVPVAIFGPTGSGKSALIVRYIAGMFLTDYDPTIED